jgi:hypothetical protein
VRHDGRTNDSERKHECVIAIMSRNNRHEASSYGGPVRLHEPQLHDEAQHHGSDQRRDDGFELTKTSTLQAQHDDGVERSQYYAPGDGHAEQQLESERTAEYFGDITSDDGDLGTHPLDGAPDGRILRTTQLRQILACHQPEASGKELQEYGTATRQHHDPEQGVAELRTPLDIGGQLPGSM